MIIDHTVGGQFQFPRGTAGPSSIDGGTAVELINVYASASVIYLLQLEFRGLQGQSAQYVQNSL